jgi:hypothetical protein
VSNGTRPSATFHGLHADSGRSFVRRGAFDRPQPEWSMAKVNKSTHPASDVRGAGTPRRLPTGARSTASAIRPTALQPTSARGWAAQEASRSRTQHPDVARPPAAARGDHARGTRHFTRHSSSVRRGVAMHPWWHHQRQPWEESTAVQMAHSSVTIRGRNRPRARASRPKTSRPGRPRMPRSSRCTRALWQHPG